jgi:phosphoserine phosphatase
MPIKVVFLDCDGTLTKVKSSWEYLHRRLNLWTENADAYQRLFREGKIDYHEFCRRDALLWKGLPLSAVYGVVGEISYRENAGGAVGELKKMGVLTIIISSGLSLLVDRVRADLSVDRAISNELVSQDGHLTGGVRINVEYNRKGPLVKKFLKGLGLRKEESAAVGDGDGDAGMFDEVILPISCGADKGALICPDRVRESRTLMGAVEIIRGYR